MTHSYVWHDSFICVAWLIHMCDTTHSRRNRTHHHRDGLDMWDMTHLYMGHDSFIHVIWHILGGIERAITVMALICVTRLICYFIILCGTWLIHMCDMTRPCISPLLSCRKYFRRDIYTWHDSYVWPYSLCWATPHSRIILYFTSESCMLVSRTHSRRTIYASLDSYSIKRKKSFELRPTLISYCISPGTESCMLFTRTHSRRTIYAWLDSYSIESK